MEKGSEIILSELKDYIKNEISLASNSIENEISTNNEKIYNKVCPVGFVYIQFKNQSTPSELGMIGTWSEITSIGEGRYLALAGNNRFTYGTDYTDGLPNIRGTVDDIMTGFPDGSHSSSGALGFSSYIGNQAAGGGSYECYRIYFSAADFNSIYGSSTFVRPAATIIKIWKRIS